MVFRRIQADTLFAMSVVESVEIPREWIRCHVGGNIILWSVVSSEVLLTTCLTANPPPWPLAFFYKRFDTFRHGGAKTKRF